MQRHERDFIDAARLQGEAALGLNQFTEAGERLHHALARARAVNLAEEELAALVALAELRRQQDDPKAARELLDDVWESAERGPYPLIHADACNVLAQIERDAGSPAAAVAAATKAYRLVWCDGEPYAYHWGLVAAPSTCGSSAPRNRRCRRTTNRSTRRCRRSRSTRTMNFTWTSSDGGLLFVFGVWYNSDNRTETEETE